MLTILLPTKLPVRTKIRAQEITAGSVLFAHIDRWGGSYDVHAVSATPITVQTKKGPCDMVVVEAADGHRHTLEADDHVFVYETYPWW